MDWKVSMSDADVMAFSAEYPQTMQRWGDQVNVFIVEKEGISTLTIKTTLGHAPNTEYIRLFVTRIAGKIEI